MVATTGVAGQGEVVLHRRRVSVVADGAVLGSLAKSCRRSVGLGGIAAQKDVVDVAVVAAVDGGVAGYLGAMRYVVGGGSFEDRFEGDCAANEVVDERAALTEYLQRDRGREDVVLDQIGSVTHLHEEVALVVVEEVPRYAGALRLPVQPSC